MQQDGSVRARVLRAGLSKLVKQLNCGFSRRSLRQGSQRKTSLYEKG
jgi:hypothetical protein